MRGDLTMSTLETKRLKDAEALYSRIRLLWLRIIKLSVDRPAKVFFYGVLTDGVRHLSGMLLGTEQSGISRLGYCSAKHSIFLGSLKETLIIGSPTKDVNRVARAQDRNPRRAFMCALNVIP